MGSSGTWLAMCDTERMLSIEQLATHVEVMKNTTVAVDGEVLVLTVDDELTGRTAEIIVGASTEPHVALESEEIAESFAEGHPRQAEIAAAKARYEITWDLRAYDELGNPLLILGESLGRLTGAIIFDAYAGSFPFDP